MPAPLPAKNASGSADPWRFNSWGPFVLGAIVIAAFVVPNALVVLGFPTFAIVSIIHSSVKLKRQSAMLMALLGSPLQPIDRAKIKEAVKRARANTRQAPWTDKDRKALTSDLNRERESAVRRLVDLDLERAIPVLEQLALADHAADEVALEGLKRAAQDGDAKAHDVLARIRAAGKFQGEIDDFLRRLGGYPVDRPPTDIATFEMDRASSVELIAAARSQAEALASASDLSSRLRAQALREKAHELEAASDVSSVAIHARQLRELLQPPAAAPAPGSNALPRPKYGWIAYFERRLPTPLAALVLPLAWTAIIGGTVSAISALLPASATWIGGPLFILGILGVGLGFSQRKPKDLLVGAIALAQVTAIGARQGHLPLWLVPGLLTALVLFSWPELSRGVMTGLGVPSDEARAAIFRNAPASPTHAQRWWTRALAGTALARGQASADLEGRPQQESEAMVPAVAALATNAPDAVTPQLVWLLAESGSPIAETALDSLARNQPQLAQASRTALADWQERKRLVREAGETIVSPPTIDDAQTILAEARAQLAAPTASFAERLRAQAVSRALAAAEAASDDERALAIKRLAALLKK